MAIERENPYLAMNFLVEISTGEGSPITLGFAEVTGITSGQDVVQYREGSDPTNAPRRLPGKETYENATFKRGVTGHLDLWQWREEVRNGGTVWPPTRTVEVKLLDENQSETPAMTWKLLNAWPVKISAPKFDAAAGTTTVAFEELVIAFDRLEIT